MRILNVNATLDMVWGGGGAERVRRLSAALAKNGHTVTILSINIGGEKLANIPNIKDVKLVLLRCLNKRFLIPVLPISQLARLINEHDIVHLSGHWTILNAVIYWLVKAQKKPYAVSPVGSLALFGRSQKLKRVYNALVGNSIIKGAQVRIAVTPSEVSQFGACGLGENEVVVIPNGVDIDAFTEVDPEPFRMRYKLGNFPLILFMGRLNLIKGPDLLLEAFAKVANTFPSHLLVYAGPDEGMGTGLRDKALTYGISNRVHFLGYVGGEEKIAAYRAAKLLVIPSRMEAMSIVVLEGGAAGTPVLITDQCGFDLVEEIGGGCVVRAEVEALSQGLDRMLSDPGKLLTKGYRLRELVRQDFTWDVAALRLFSVFERAIESYRH